MYIYIYMYMCRERDSYIFRYMYIQISIYTFIYVDVRVQEHICVYKCVYVEGSPSCPFSRIEDDDEGTREGLVPPHVPVGRREHGVPVAAFGPNLQVSSDS